MTVKDLRKQTGLTQVKFAEKTGISVSNIRHWEQRYSNPPDYLISLLERVLKIDGYVTDSKKIYEKVTYVKPVKHDYSDENHQNYYKYTCPVCDTLGNPHQIHPYETNCSLCNVNLIWNEEKTDEDKDDLWIEHTVYKNKGYETWFSCPFCNKLASEETKCCPECGKKLIKAIKKQ